MSVQSKDGGNGDANTGNDHDDYEVAIPQLAFIFVSLSLFTAVFLSVFIDSLTDNSKGYVVFLRSFPTLENGTMLVWILFIHCIRMQLGVVFNFQDRTLNVALKEVKKDLGADKARSIVRGNIIIWLLLLPAIGSMPRVLTRWEFWPAAVDLAIQAFLILAWWIVNWKVIRRDVGVLGNVAVGIADFLFGIVVVGYIVTGLARQYDPDDWYPMFVGYFDDILNALVVTVVVLLALEIVFAYRQVMLKSWDQLWSVVKGG